MSSFSEIFILALSAVFVQNCVFNASSDSGIIHLSMQHPQKLAAVSALVSIFSLLISASIYPFDILLNIEVLDYMPVRGIICLAAALLWYVIIRSIVRKVPLLNSVFGQYVTPAALNGAVLSAPLLLSASGVSSFAGAVVFALGSGVAFALAVWLIKIGLERFDNPEISSNFRGAPVLLIYIGLLAVAFSAF